MVDNCCFYHIIGFLYESSVLYALITDLFIKLKEFKAFSQNAFMDKFKQISELRIFITMIVTLIFLPFIIAIVIFLINQYHDNVVTFVDPDPIRQIPLSIYYNLIYIDQILLKYFVQDDKTKDAVASNPNVIKSKSSSNFNISTSNQINNSYRKLNNQYIDDKNAISDNKIFKSKSHKLINQYSG